MVEPGTHDKLIENKNLYSKLVKLQNESFSMEYSIYSILISVLKKDGVWKNQCLIHGFYYLLE